MKCSIRLIVATLSVASAAAALAQNAQFTASRTFEYDPNKTGGAVAYWDRTAGLQDLGNNGNTRFGLVLQKNVPTAANVASGAVLNGLKGVVVAAGDRLGYDMSNASTQTGSGPRFNVSYVLADGTNGFSFVGGSANAAKMPAPQDATWTRYTLQLQNPAHAFPVVPVGAVLTQVTLIVDEQGTYTLDNIRFRNDVASKPGSSSTSP